MPDNPLPARRVIKHLHALLPLLAMLLIANMIDFYCRWSNPRMSQSSYATLVMVVQLAVCGCLGLGIGAIIWVRLRMGTPIPRPAPPAFYENAKKISKELVEMN